MKFFLLLLLCLGLGLGVVVVEVLRGRRGWKVAAFLVVVVLVVLRVVMMDVSLVSFLEELLCFRRCLKMMKMKKKRLKRLVFGRISIDWSLRKGAVDSFGKKTDYHLQCATCACCVVSSFRLFEEASLDMCLGAGDGGRVYSTG